MWPEFVAVVLLVLGAAIGVVGNWLKPPAKMGGRAIVAVFAVLLIAAAGITYINTAAADSGDTPGNDPQGRGTAAASAPASTSRPATKASGVTPGAGVAAPVTDRPESRMTTRPRTAPTGTPRAPAQPCIAGSWALTTIVDYLSHSDQTVTMSYETGWETRTYRADGTFSIANDWHERGYDNTLTELKTHSKGTADGRYRLSGRTVTYDPVSSVGNWTLTVDGEVRRQSSVVFSRGEESITCTSASLKVVSGSDYKASYKRK
jgi:hypothetical protein